MSDYIDFIAYQDDAIIQRILRYYRRRGQPHPQPKGDLHQGYRHRENDTHHDDHLLWTCVGRLFWWHPMPADDGRFIQIKADLSKMIKKHVLAGKVPPLDRLQTSMIFLKSLAISRILCTFVSYYNIKIKQLWSYWCFFLAGIVAIIGAIEVIRRDRRMQDVKAPIFLSVSSCVLLLVAGIILS